MSPSDEQLQDIGEKIGPMPDLAKIIANDFVQFP